MVKIDILSYYMSILRAAHSRNSKKRKNICTQSVGSAAERTGAQPKGHAPVENLFCFQRVSAILIAEIYRVPAEDFCFFPVSR